MSEPKTRKAKSVVVWANYDNVQPIPPAKDTNYREGWGVDANDLTTVQEALAYVKKLPDGTEYRIFTEHKAGVVKHTQKIKVEI